MICYRKKYKRISPTQTTMKLKSGIEPSHFKQSNYSFIIIVFIITLIGSFIFYYFNNIKVVPLVLGETEEISIKIPDNYAGVFKLQNGQNSLYFKANNSNLSKKNSVNKGSIYNNIFENTDVMIINFGTKLQQEIVLTKPNHPSKFEYKLDNFEQYQVNKNSDGSIDISKSIYLSSLDYNKIIKIFTFNSPFIEDAENIRYYDLVEINIIDDIFTIELDNKSLVNVEYPLILNSTITVE